jgi:hypothetical protein
MKEVLLLNDRVFDLIDVLYLLFPFLEVVLLASFLLQRPPFPFMSMFFVFNFENAFSILAWLILPFEVDFLPFRDVVGLLTERCQILFSSLLLPHSK